MSQDLAPERVKIETLGGLTALCRKGSITTAEHREWLGPERPKISTQAPHMGPGPPHWTVSSLANPTAFMPLLHTLLHKAAFERKREGHTHTFSSLF